MHRRCWQRGSTTTDGAACGLPGASAGHVGRWEKEAIRHGISRTALHRHWAGCARKEVVTILALRTFGPKIG
jgi:hypothetical protein